MTVLLSTIATLSVLGILAAVILYFVAQKFKVEEDPRIDEVETMVKNAVPICDEIPEKPKLIKYTIS